MQEAELHSRASDASIRLPGGHQVRISSFDATTGNPRVITSDGALAERGNYVQRALDHIRSISGVLGLALTQSPEFTADPHIQRTSSGAVIVHLQQQYKGIPIFQAAQAVRFRPDGVLQDTAGSSITVSGEVAAASRLRIQEAVLRAAQYVAVPHADELGATDQFGEPLNLPSVDLSGFIPMVIATFPNLPTSPTVLAAGPFGDEIKASLLWFPLREALRLAWEVILAMPGYQGQYRTIVDADNGEILYCHQMVQTVAARGNVYRIDGGPWLDFKFLFAGRNLAGEDRIYAVDQNGQLLSYGDAGTPGNVSSPVVVGFGGWLDFRFLFAGRNLAGEDRIYAADQNGQLLSYGDAGTPGNVSSPVVVGFGGWLDFRFLFAGRNLAGEDRIYAVDQNGQLLSYGDTGTPGNVSSPVVVGFGGWLDFKFLFAGRNLAGEDRIYAVDQNGQLLSYGDAGTPGNVSSPVVVGFGGWLDFRFLFAGRNLAGEDRIYAANQNGQLLSYGDAGTPGNVSSPVVVGGRQMTDFPLPLADYNRPAAPPPLPVGFPDTWVAVDSTVGNSTNAHQQKDGPSFQGTVQGGTVTFDPADAVGVDQEILNIFYYCCYMHDYFYLLGFREADGNFQQDNFSRGGAQSDAVDARAFPGAISGTANMLTPADGSGPIMQMGLVTSTNRHTALDSSVIFHEFMHGVTNRLVGGPMNDNALEAPQSGGMGEGWGDYNACTVNNTTVVGAWVVNRPGGIRAFPYDNNFPDNFGNLGTGRYTEVHNIGEIWCATLMEMTRIIGTALGVQLVVDALKLSPITPGFLDMRDSILQALDQKHAAGQLSLQDYLVAWYGIRAAFAKFGMGPRARSNGAQLSGIVADFNVNAPGQLLSYGDTGTPGNVSSPMVVGFGGWLDFKFLFAGRNLAGEDRIYAVDQNGQLLSYGDTGTLGNVSSPIVVGFGGWLDFKFLFAGRNLAGEDRIYAVDQNGQLLSYGDAGTPGNVSSSVVAGFGGWLDFKFLFAGRNLAGEDRIYAVDQNGQLLSYGDAGTPGNVSSPVVVGFGGWLDFRFLFAGRNLAGEDRIYAVVA